MAEPIVIKVFISCPNDVEVEKNVVIDVCNKLTTVFDTTEKPIHFIAKDWRDIVGQFGPRIQEQITLSIGTYHIYIGIWWMKFGSKTGKINAATGKEFESGTHEEFQDAYDKWELNGDPQIFLFFKNPKAIPHKETIQLEQYKKLTEFYDSQKENGWIHHFKKKEELKDNIWTLLLKKGLGIGNETKIEKKQEFIREHKTTLPEIKLIVPDVTPSYISRKTSHFLKIKEKVGNPILQIEKLSISELIQVHSKIIVLGDAGSGKSTELQNLYHKLNGEGSTLFPIYQRLNIYTPEQGLENFLPQSWTNLPEDMVLIIWDGLDEIQPEHFNTVVRQILHFCTKYPKLKLVISCRTNFYELPVDNSHGTLTDFEPYFLNDVSLYEAKNYYSQKYNSEDSVSFIKEVFDNKLEDLITKPFFLMLLAEAYSASKSLNINRAELYRLFVLSRIELDESHFKGTFDIREKKEEIMMLLEKVALSMEILGRNHIDESEILKIISSKEFKTLKFSAFKKKEGEETTWQFEHNNIQEYIASKALSKLPFEKVIKFLTFEPNHTKLIPSWVNTLTFLFSLLNENDTLFKNLLAWMLQNEKEIIVKFERDKISETVKNQIFQSIYNHYKEHDVWVNSNKFSGKELSNFGQSDANIKFLVNELKGNTSRTNRINAISLLGGFKYYDDSTKNKISKLFLQQINNHINDSEIVRTSIYSLKYSELYNEKNIDQIVNKLNNQKNRYVRSAIYSLLLETKLTEKYLDYFIEGDRIKHSKSAERSGTTLADEGWNLKECFKSVKSFEGIKKLVNYVSENKRFEYGTHEICNSIVDNATTVYKDDNRIFDPIFKWFVKEAKKLNSDKMTLFMNFFVTTQTLDIAFKRAWDMSPDILQNKSFALARLTSPETLIFVIEKYKNHDITNKELEDLFFNMRWIQNQNLDLFESLIRTKTNFNLVIPEKIDYDGIRKRKQQEDFDLLFDSQKFFDETINIFDQENKSEFTFDELYEVRKENHRHVELEDYYSGAALRLIREFGKPDKSINKQVIINWFNKKINVEWYMIGLIYQSLQDDNIQISIEQIEWIKKWCLNNIKTIDFKKSISIDQDGKTSIKTKAIYLCFFIKKFNIEVDKKVLLDMLSFDYFEQHDWIGINYLIDKLSKQEITDRMLQNLRKGIIEPNVVKNHIKFLSKNHVKKAYPFILKQIINPKTKYYTRQEFLNIYLKNTDDIKSIKNILPKTDNEVKWSIIEKLRVYNEIKFLEEYLIPVMRKKPFTDENIQAAENLIRIQNIDGLKYYTNWIKKTPANDLSSRSVSCLNALTNINAVPLLINLLDISYSRNIIVERFDSLKSLVLNALYNVALISDNNFITVKSALEKFMTKNLTKYKHVNYLLHNIQRMENQFYMNKAQTYTIDNVKEIIKLIN
jgi:hypothetical protein